MRLTTKVAKEHKGKTTPGHRATAMVAQARFFLGVPSYYHGQIFDFPAQIWATGQMPATNRTSVSSNFYWREKFEISRPWFLDATRKSAIQIGPIYFCFLRASVTPWCKGFVFGCGFVAL